MNQKYVRFIPVITVFGCLVPISIQAQIVPDTTLPENSLVTPQGEVIQIDGGTTRGNNLFHSFQEFSVPVGMEASFNNADTISNILSRVTGGGESLIDGGISANGAANLFLINPVGIVFGEGAFLNVGGSFIGTTAESLLFPDGIEYSASDLQAPPILTINAPIGLTFRDEPGTITNFSIFDIDNLVGLNVAADRTLALIGGDVLIDGGFLSTDGGRIEIGSVAGNNTVSLTQVEKGWDVDYEGVENFQDIDLTLAAFVESRGANTGDIEVQGKNISLIEGSEIAINTFEGQAGNLTVIASESLEISGNAAEVNSGDFESSIFSNVSNNASGEGSNLLVETDILTLKNGGQITARTLGSGQGVDLNIKASEIEIDTPFDDLEVFKDVGIFAQVDSDATGNGGNVTIDTSKLTIRNGGQISTTTFGTGDAGNLLVNASEFIELIGTIPESNTPSALFADVGNQVTATGDGGDLTINTPRLVVRDGAQIGTTAQNSGNGGNLTINASESILLSGFSDLAELRGEGISGIFVSAEPSLEDSGEIFRTTGNGGTLNLTTPELVLEKGASISADTFSLGDAGDANINVNRLIIRDGSEIRASSFVGANSPDPEESRGSGGIVTINATKSVEVIGTGEINGTPVNSSLLTIAESNGRAGNLNLTTNQLTVSDGGAISTSALGAAGNLTIRANNLNLNQGTLNAETAAGTGGNITLDIDDTITLSSESQISAAATDDANGGNINIDTTFIIASPQGNNDILANAQQGTGGRIIIDAESIFGLRVRSPSDRTNDIDASGGVDGEVIINTPDTDLTGEALESPPALVEGEQTVVQACRSDRLAETSSGLTILGKGGVPPKPTEPLNSDAIIVDGQTTATNLQSQYPEIKPIKTQYGDIMPARDMIKTEDGRVILTAYPTDNIDRRTPHISAKCN